MGLCRYQSAFAADLIQYFCILGGTGGRWTQFCMAPGAMQRVHTKRFQCREVRNAGEGGKCAAISEQ